MNSKQRKAAQLNTRLDYLIDAGLTAPEIKDEMSGFRITLAHIERVINKRRGVNNGA